MLEAREGWQVCGEATTRAGSGRTGGSAPAGIAVIDLEMSELDGLEATREIRKTSPQIEVLIFTMHDSEYLIREVLAAGARAFVLKSEGGRKLIEAIDAVLEHILRG